MLAAIYDVHGNLPALSAVLAEIRREGVEQVVIGGDVVPGPMPGECLAALRELEIPTRFIHGNGERAVLQAHRGEDLTAIPPHAHPAIRWVVEQLSADELGTLASWPSTYRHEVQGLGEVLFCHATPQNDTDIFTIRTPEESLRPIFEPTGADLVVCGHTHMQFDRQVGSVRVVNAGSVGMPFGEPGAYWLLLGPKGVEHQRSGYDLESAAVKIDATGYPGQFEIRKPPSEEEILKRFEGVNHS